MPGVSPPIQALVTERGVGQAQDESGAAPFFAALEQARLPLRYMARLFSAGNEDEIAAVYRKLIAVRVYRRAQNTTGTVDAEAQAALDEAGLTAEVAQAIFELTAKPTFDERFVVPPLAREVNLESMVDPFSHKTEAGFGFRRDAKRGQ